MSLDLIGQVLSMAVTDLETKEDRKMALSALLVHIRTRAHKVPVGNFLVSPECFAELEKLARDGRKIQTIKALRTETGARLTEAKKAAEEVWGTGRWD